MADLLHATIKAEMDTLQHNYTWDMVDRSANTMIVDSKWVLKFKHLADRSIDKFKARLVGNGFSQIQ
jgi:hypothetical protein